MILLRVRFENFTQLSIIEKVGKSVWISNVPTHLDRYYFIRKNVLVRKTIHND